MKAKEKCYPMFPTWEQSPYNDKNKTASEIAQYGQSPLALLIYSQNTSKKSNG